MTTKEVVRRLNKLCPEDYFEYTLFPGERRVFARRSLSDLATYFKRWNVSEKQLLQSLRRAGFQVRICGDIHKCVAFKITKNRKNIKKDDFMPSPLRKWPGYHTFDTDPVIVDKFTKEYINSRFNYDL